MSWKVWAVGSLVVVGLTLLAFSIFRSVPPPATVENEPQTKTQSADSVAIKKEAAPSKKCVPTVPPASLNLNPFYKKFCLVQGIPLISSASVSDKAFAQAEAIMNAMLAPRPDITAELLKHGIKVAILGEQEKTTELPEYAFLKDDKETDWDVRARGLGATTDVPLSSGAEENLLCLSTDPYIGESIFAHEFAHSIKLLGVDFIDTTFSSRLQSAYDSALSEGLWNDTYAATHVEEYWAEGVQDYFDSNIRSEPSNGIHNKIHTRSELQAYDPRLYALVAEVFPTSWRWKCNL